MGILQFLRFKYNLFSNYWPMVFFRNITSLFIFIVNGCFNLTMALALMIGMFMLCKDILTPAGYFCHVDIVILKYGLF